MHQRVRRLKQTALGLPLARRQGSARGGSLSPRRSVGRAAVCRADLQCQGLSSSLEPDPGYCRWARFGESG